MTEEGIRFKKDTAVKTASVPSFFGLKLRARESKLSPIYVYGDVSARQLHSAVECGGRIVGKALCK